MGPAMVYVSIACLTLSGAITRLREERVVGDTGRRYYRSCSRSPRRSGRRAGRRPALALERLDRRKAKNEIGERGGRRVAIVAAPQGENGRYLSSLTTVFGRARHTSHATSHPADWCNLLCVQCLRLPYVTLWRMWRCPPSLSLYIYTFFPSFLPSLPYILFALEIGVNVTYVTTSHAQMITHCVRWAYERVTYVTYYVTLWRCPTLALAYSLDR